MPADFWNKKESVIPSDILVNPCILRMIGGVKGKDVLDLGCGDGTITSVLHRRGANIIGVDKDRDVIEIARSRGGTYWCKDVLDLKFDNEQFDIVYSSMVFLFLNDREISRLAGRVYAWLRKNGRFIVSDVHPTTEIQKDESKWVRHKIPADFSYFETRKIEATLYNLKGRKTSVKYYHRPLSRYIDLFSSKGFRLVRLCEPRISLEEAKKRNMVFESRNPAYIIFEFIKPE